MKFLSLVVAICLCQAISKRATAQDHSWLIDIARANAESMRNYDVSYQFTTLIDEAGNSDAADSSNNKPRTHDEQRIVGRIALDKASTDNPTRILHARTIEFYLKEKLQRQYTEFKAWKDGIGIEYRSFTPNAEITQGPQKLVSLYRGGSMPFFETGHGEIQSPSSNSNYWNDTSEYWESRKVTQSQFTLTRGRSGAIRLEQVRERERVILEYDPISNLRVSDKSFLIDPVTKIERTEPSLVRQYGWENVDNVYRLRRRTEQIRTSSVSQSEICSFYWHQFNTDVLEFPTDIFTDFTVEKCTSFLTDGQTEMTENFKQGDDM